MAGISLDGMAFSNIINLYSPLRKLKARSNDELANKSLKKVFSLGEAEGHCFTLTMKNQEVMYPDHITALRIPRGQKYETYLGEYGRKL